MYLNYYFFQSLCPEIKLFLEGFQLRECFSQEKEELIFLFKKNKEEKYIKVSVTSEMPYILFPQNVIRAKKNTKDIFSFAINGTVKNCSVIYNDRSFLLELDNESTFLFKMHGSVSNIIAYDKNNIPHLFKNILKTDLLLTPKSLEKNLPLSFERFQELNGEIKNFLPTLGKECERYLSQQNYYTSDTEQQWKLIQYLLKEFEKKQFYIQNNLLTLFPPNGESFISHSAIEANNIFVQKLIKDHYLNKNKKKLLSQISNNIRKYTISIEEKRKRLQTLATQKNYKELADILMANIHKLQKGMEKATLFNFYQNAEVEIPLNKLLSPQKNAELFYKKYKNQFIEVENLETSIKQKTEIKENLQKKLADIERIENVKVLKEFSEIHETLETKKKELEHKHYWAYEKMGYEIRVGTNGKNNEKLLSQAGNKNDMWLHVKDAPGSHVIIKWKPGQNFPQPVIEYAAGLAAKYSKKKNETLCPVTVTPRKFVRKAKGGKPGTVIVEKEEVILVPPL
ncbi:MAG: NFACT RNA binding domain-containing protein [Chitinophagaceae bacterium]|nr:NFACT RNA binding domain-containing protein [Chitinophagaceae bacterium]